jgi:hypothetical protein
LPPAFDVAVKRAMEKRPEQRAKSAGQLMRWLETQVPAVKPADAPVEANADEAFEPASPSAESRGWLRVRLPAHILVYAALWTGGYLAGRGI